MLAFSAEWVMQQKGNSKSSRAVMKEAQGEKAKGMNSWQYDNIKYPRVGLKICKCRLEVSVL